MYCCRDENMSRLKYACAILLLKLTISNSYTIDIFDSSRLDENGKPSLIETVGDIIDFKNPNIQNTLRISGLHSEIRRGNVFEDFVNAMLDLLTGYPGRMLSRFCRIIYKELDEFEFKYTKKLANHFRELSKMDRDELGDEMRNYQQEMQKKTPELKAFIDAMNQVFTMEEGIKFRDYALDVRDYANLDKRDIVEETRAVLKSIIKAVKKLSIRDQNELEKKLRKAVRKHDDDTGPNIYSILFYQSTPKA